jgi:phosphatidylserine/phosphatidylglycerophosphate/cardiolipin synthase-like enzyme
MRTGIAAAAIVMLLLLPLSVAFLPGDGRAAAVPPTPPPDGPVHPLLSSASSEAAATLPAVLLAAVYYYADRDDEFFVLANPGETAVDLTGWSVTDLEATVTFPSGATVAAGAALTATRNTTSYAEDTLTQADFTYDRGPGPRLLGDGPIRLNNDGDEVLLVDPQGRVVDAFVYGGSVYAGDGWEGDPAEKVGRGKISKRAVVDGVFQDTDTAADWDALRSYGLGQSDFPLRTFDVDGDIVAFLSPQEARAPLLEFLENARESLAVSLYTMTSEPLADALVRAAARGVRVRLLLEGMPVGGLPREEWNLAWRVREAGGEVRFMVSSPDEDVLNRYRFLHAKYGVVDDEIVFVGSENWGDRGFPPGTAWGNRGWTVAVQDRALAAYVGQVFEADWEPRHRDSVAIEAYDVTPVDVPSEASAPGHRFPVAPLRVTGPAVVTPVLAPDTALRDDTVLGLLRSARETLLIEQFYAYTQWGDAPNLYLEAAIEAARRGVAVRILLDGSWYNVDDEDPIDNDDTVAYVNAVAAREGLDLEAKIGQAAAHDLLKFHTKGVVVDGATVLVGSINWNRNSVTNNREVALIVEQRDVAGFFAAAIEHDWKDDVTPPRAVLTVAKDVVVAGEPVAFRGTDSWDDVAVAAYVWDFDGDGRADATGPWVEYAFDEPGEHVVTLVVRDAWGNEDATAATVRVVDAAPDGGDLAAGVAAAGLAVALAAAGLVLFLRRRKKGLYKRP